MTKQQKAILYRLGVEARLVALKQEEKELLKELGRPNGGWGGKRTPKKHKKKRKPMSAALRKAIGVRMRRMWAEKRRAAVIRKESKGGA